MYQLLKGTAFNLPLADASIQTIITSPPYWGLRKYSDQNADQYGLEKTPEDYVLRTVEWLHEAWRVLKNDGILWLNIGDSYYGSLKGAGGSGPSSEKQISNPGSYHDAEILAVGSSLKHPIIRRKSLCLIPERVAIAAQEMGWIVRSRCIWHKLNVMPHPVKDRPTNDVEHIWQLTKSEKYYYDREAVAVPAKPEYFSRYNSDFAAKAGTDDAMPNGSTYCPKGKRTVKTTRNLRTVWSFSNGQTKDAHFATFNAELPRRCILASTRAGDTVLDPFCGSGTTGLVAVGLERRFVGVDLAYHDVARKRIEAALSQRASNSKRTGV